MSPSFVYTEMLAAIWSPAKTSVLQRYFNPQGAGWPSSAEASAEPRHEATSLLTSWQTNRRSRCMRMTRDRGLWEGRRCTGAGVRGAACEWQASCPNSGVFGFIDTKDNPMRSLWNRASIGWCRTFHPEPLWPVHGQYRCRACLRTYSVPWQDGDVRPTRPATSQMAAPVSVNEARYYS